MADGQVRFAYLEPGLDGTPVVELVQLSESMMQFYDYIKSTSAPDAEGR